MSDKTGPEVRVEVISMSIDDVDYSEMMRLGRSHDQLTLIIGDFTITASEDHWLKISAMVRAMVAQPSRRRGVSAGDV